MQIILFFSHSLVDFRLAELQSVAELFGIPIAYDKDADPSCPFLLAEVETEAQARLLGSRCILVRHIVAYWADGPTYADLHAALLVQPQLWAAYQTDVTFRVTAMASHSTISIERQRDLAEELAYLDLQGKVDLRNPELDIIILEDHTWGQKEPTDRLRTLKRVWVGRRICDGRRDLLDVFHLKKRAYVGNTSMEAEVSLVMANMALAAPGKLMYDPFAGTGSMLFTASHFGAYVVGSDLDGRHLRGHRKEHAAASYAADTSLVDGARQYDVLKRLLGCLIFDLTQHPWRKGGVFDAILCDPPYGVRAGAKRIGRKKGLATEPRYCSDGTPNHEREGYLPPLEPWPMEDVLDTLLRTAREMLKPGGRLVFFLPTVTAEYTDADLPTLPGLQLVANSPQCFNKWTRRLITMVRTGDDLEPAASTTDANGVKHVPAHVNFHKKYFTGFDAARFEASAGGSGVHAGS